MQHLRPAGARLGIYGPNGALYETGGDALSCYVIRSGPLAVGIRYEIAPKIGPLAETKLTVDLTFPVSKSWVQVDWRINDPDQVVQSARAEIAQNLDRPTGKEPTLVDFGIRRWFTCHSRRERWASCTRVRQALMRRPNAALGRSFAARDRLEPFVVRPVDRKGGDADGWAHVMDHSRCLALAVDEFGRGGDDSIEVTAEGQVSISRRFATSGADFSTTKNLRFWLHFVGFPPHVTAATSPQSMLSPLVVSISEH